VHSRIQRLMHNCMGRLDFSVRQIFCILVVVELYLKNRQLIMKFELLPTIDLMIGLYEKPRTTERFQEYLKILQGNTNGDMEMPVSGFNPMAKEHILVRLNELKNLKAEEIMKETIARINQQLTIDNNETFKVALNLPDDLKGGWTNRYTSDYDSKFRINGLVTRKFCTPVLWTSEQYSRELIETRTQEYIYRTIFWLTKPKPLTLKEHVLQEHFVATNTGKKENGSNFTALEQFYKNHQDTDNYHIIFNFFYGDNASKLLSFPTFGINETHTGFEYCTYYKKD
jgi:hypothetical protein